MLDGFGFTFYGTTWVKIAGKEVLINGLRMAAHFKAVVDAQGKVGFRGFLRTFQ